MCIQIEGLLVTHEFTATEASVSQCMRQGWDQLHVCWPKKLVLRVKQVSMAVTAEHRHQHQYKRDDCLLFRLVEYHDMLNHVVT